MRTKESLKCISNKPPYSRTFLFLFNNVLQHVFLLRNGVQCYWRAFSGVPRVKDRHFGDPLAYLASSDVSHIRGGENFVAQSPCRATQCSACRLTQDSGVDSVFGHQNNGIRIVFHILTFRIGLS